MSRNSTIYASAYDRTTVQQSSFYPNESRTLTLDFNGALDDGQQLQSAKFDTWQGYSVVMSEPTIAEDRRSATIKIKAQYGGPGLMSCTIATVDGSQLTQNWLISIRAMPYYVGNNWSNGPSSAYVEWGTGEYQLTYGSEVLTFQNEPLTFQG